MTWWNDYVGTPFKEHGRSREGFDCWGLVRDIQERVFGVSLPDLAEEYSTTADMHALYSSPAHWRNEWAEVTEAQAGDLLVLRINGLPVHVGVAVDDQYFIHCWAGANTTVEKLGSFHWSARIESIWRHRRCLQ